MSIIIELGSVKSLTEPRPADFTSNQGFNIYWQQAGINPDEVARAISDGNSAGFEGARELAASVTTAAQDAGWSDILNILGRVSSVSLEQLLIRHLPEQVETDAEVFFVPGACRPVVFQGKQLAINVFSLEQRKRKLFVEDTPLLSLLCHFVHRICTQKFAKQAGNSREQVVSSFLSKLFLEGAATLFFTLPTSGVVSQQWAAAEKRREHDFAKLREKCKDESSNPEQLRADLERQFALTAASALTARYPIGTYMCQVIESAFGRNHLVQLLSQPSRFAEEYEQARKKFALPDKYSLDL
ncbi:MAG: hypothetical protein FH749_02690 [Firmicutes bacterium]|nr:hypothetical protein [Bacillota bacterium]